MGRTKKIENNESEDLKLQVTIKELQKRFGFEAMHMATEEPNVDRIPFGIPSIDEKLGGGIPRRRFSILWGAESSCKSSACLTLIASAQKQGLTCAYLDLENKFEKEWAIKLGVDLTTLLLGRFDHSEQALDTFLELCRTHEVDLFIVDSIHALSPKEEREDKKGDLNSTEKKTIALLPRVLGQFFRMSGTDVYKGNTAVVLVGQVRTGGIGSFFTHAELTGGAALKHSSSMTIFLRKGQNADSPVQKIKETYLDEKTGKERYRTVSKPIGIDLVMKLEKKKVPNCVYEGTEIHVPFFYDSGFKEPEGYNVKTETPTETDS